MGTKAISYWLDTSSLPRFAKLQHDLKVDVVIVGAGITGVTAAYLFKQAGQTVALLDRGRLGGVDTSYTTAHLTHVTDERLHELVRNFGKAEAQLAWQAGSAAIDQIAANIRRENIECEFTWVPGYLHARLQGDQKADRDTLQEDAALAEELGFRAGFLEEVPFFGLPGVKFEHQAKFHPLKYLAALARTISGDGSYVFEHTDVEEVQDKPLAVMAGPHKIRCRYVVLATHTPLAGKTNIVSATLFQTKLALYTSYAVGAQLPAGTLPEALFWDTSEPYYYLRVERRRGLDYAIFGGEDHKTGQKPHTEDSYCSLEQTLSKFVAGVTVAHRWSGQVIETNDGLPLVGETSSRQFAATGFAGNGMTFGTLSAMMAVDAYAKRQNPWSDLFSTRRKKLKGGAVAYLRENKDYPYYLVRDWIGRREGKSLKSVRPGEGKVLRLKGKKVAAYRDEEGKITQCSPVCTHLGCIVGWNEAEKTWDCPCHGSRFKPNGEVLSGPAEEALAKIEPAEEKQSFGSRRSPVEAK
jgi:glycine/D-amino acid oxidase-like deaminating enzyme/nitrite reductase/ring-hydroxylating ferredoxin subunit